jgi:hypothetical protein
VSPIVRMCSRCRKLVPAGETKNGRCLRCETERQRERDAARGSGSPTNRSAQARFRREVLKRAGNRCQRTLANGQRCPITAPLFAHHNVKGSSTRPMGWRSAVRTTERWTPMRADYIGPPRWRLLTAGG